MSRVGQNHILYIYTVYIRYFWQGDHQIYVELARTIYIRCISGFFGTEITKYTVIHGANIWFWPTLNIRSYWVHTYGFGQPYIYWVHVYGTYWVHTYGFGQPYIYCVHVYGTYWVHTYGFGQPYIYWVHVHGTYWVHTYGFGQPYIYWVHVYGTYWVHTYGHIGYIHTVLANPTNELMRRGGCPATSEIRRRRQDCKSRKFICWPGCWAPALKTEANQGGTGQIQCGHHVHVH